MSEKQIRRCKNGNQAKWHITNYNTTTFTMKCFKCGEIKEVPNEYWKHTQKSVPTQQIGPQKTTLQDGLRNGSVVPQSKIHRLFLEA